MSLSENADITGFDLVTESPAFNSMSLTGECEKKLDLNSRHK